MSGFGNINPFGDPKETLFVVDKEINFKSACREAESFYGGKFNHHCANNNGILSMFDYPTYRKKLKTHYIFIGVRREDEDKRH